MTRREAWLSAGAVFAAALVVRIVAAVVIDFPRPEDTAYYVGVAENLLSGRGLVTDALWSFHLRDLGVTHAAFEVWLPLPTFLAAIPMAFLGHTFAAAQVSSMLVGALVPVLAWRLAADVAEERALPPGRARTLALGTGLTAAVYLPLVLFSALPDSTIPFTALVLAACLLMARLLRRPASVRFNDLRLLALGVTLGLAALTRNEAAWIALVWVGLVLVARAMPASQRVRLIAVPAAISIAIFAPWAVRNWQAFGSPLPGQAASNALSLLGTDIFAWHEEPTLARYLAAGPARLLELRVVGIVHNLMNVLLLLGIPVALVGLLALPWTGRGRALRPLLLFSAITFLFTSLVFPVSTTWGTFLHAAGAVHVLLILSGLLALDAAIAALGRRRGWTRPVAWLGPALTIFGSILLSVALLPIFGHDGAVTRERFDALGRELPAAGVALGPGARPVITDYPIWLAEETGTPSLALPDEPVSSLLDLARTYGAAAVVVVDDPASERRHLRDLLRTTDPCLAPVPFGETRPDDDPLADTRVFRVVCP